MPILSARSVSPFAYGFGKTLSASVTPDTGAMFPIFATTLTTGVNSITFSSIPQTYAHLQLRMVNGIGGAGSNSEGRFNGDTGSNYDSQYYFSNTAPTTGAGAEYTRSGFYVDVTTTLDNTTGITIMDILDYTNTNKYKVVRCQATRSINQNTSPSAYNWFANGRWRNTSAITSITIRENASNNFSVGSNFVLYGIKGA